MKFARSAVVFAAVVLGLVGLVPSATAGDETWRFDSEWDTGSLDHNPTNGVHTRSWNGGPWQIWAVKRYGDGTFRFMNTGSLRCLDNSEHGVRGFGCNDGSWQRWKVNSWGDGTVEIVSTWNNHCLDNSWEGIRTVGCNGLEYQRWRVR
ncbi:RICIN domain-containing protein [Actinosynnema sp. NPDC047251]|uniref:Uncharacterized protein n=1 Tax=Saccharothrix espanaensis (strain ATCC 51144 / DSM 44229 / JCM 9112 / NBRC 15066 / NRRL 15764) TaxID=1179773 RepID=K0JXA7_SACES|nr:RICIN domain-containing protein [Saccharothrix espanaensis]CCH32510.1 hypothetical protein BN6_52460 [Saccharothrix espanaensis DSM 44229]